MRLYLSSFDLGDRPDEPVGIPYWALRDGEALVVHGQRQEIVGSRDDG
jgi:hypothetical protein